MLGHLPGCYVEFVWVCYIGTADILFLRSSSGRTSSNLINGGLRRPARNRLFISISISIPLVSIFRLHESSSFGIDVDVAADELLAGPGLQVLEGRDEGGYVGRGEAGSFGRLLRRGWSRHHASNRSSKES